MPLSVTSSATSPNVDEAGTRHFRLWPSPEAVAAVCVAPKRQRRSWPAFSPLPLITTSVKPPTPAFGETEVMTGSV
eukprot:6618435-Prymnesium_polylepis.1